jgi:Protein of unknown function (DUF2628)
METHSVHGVQASEADLRTFIGPNADRYLRVWREMDEGRTRTAWNWPAFLFPELWLLYRKMYLDGALVLGILLLGAFVTNPLVSVFGSLALKVALGCRGDRLYREHAERRVAEILARHGRGALARAGGTSWPEVATVFLLVALFAPLTQNFSGMAG